MATIAGIGKFPPLQGGISSKSYWFANAMAKRGHLIHMVTERTDVDEVYAIPGINSIPCHPNVVIHRPDEVVPWHIPDDRHRILGLLNKLLEVLEREKPDVIEANYLVPYGLVAYLANQITGIPYVLRHGGSDIRKFLAGGLWPVLWRKALEGASLIVTDADSQALIRKWSHRLRTLTPYVPDISFFHPAQTQRKARPVLALIGKTNFYWRHKGWHRVIDVWQQLEGSFDFLVVTQGIGIEDFRSYVNSRMGGKVTWQGFASPWEMPSLLNSIDGLFFYEDDLPFPVFSNLAIEALFCGLPLFVDNDRLVDHYHEHGIDLGQGAELIVTLPSDDPKKAADAVTAHYHSEGSNVAPPDKAIYINYLLTNEQAILDCNGL
jgi:glycosyltransferase involved in cell wall biosynthesis